jgi:hypothetical protein
MEEVSVHPESATKIHVYSSVSLLIVPVLQFHVMTYRGTLPIPTFEIHLEPSPHPSNSISNTTQPDHHDHIHELHAIHSCSRPPHLYKNKNADEVSAIVIDIGTQTTRSGFAGEETPRSVVPTAFGYINLPSSHYQSNSNSGLAEEDAAGVSSKADLDGMAVDAPSDRRTPEGNPPNGNESNLNGNGSTVNGNKRGKVEKRFFMGDQGVNMWREGMEVGSLMRDGISQYSATFSLHLHTYMYMHSPFFTGATGRKRSWCDHDLYC